MEGQGETRVNPVFLHSLVAPLVGLADVDEVQADYCFVSPDDEYSYRRVIQRDLVPHYRGLDAVTQRKAKLALSYALSVRGSGLEDELDSHLPPFETPRNGRDFYVWLWEELFGEEDYHLAHIERYRVVRDISEPYWPGKQKQTQHDEAGDTI